MHAFPMMLHDPDQLIDSLLVFVYLTAHSVHMYTTERQSFKQSKEQCKPDSVQSAKYRSYKKNKKNVTFFGTAEVILGLQLGGED